MCKFNQLCRSLDDSCSCQRLLQLQKITQNNGHEASDNSLSGMVTYLIQAICQQAEMISLLSNQNQATNDRLVHICDHLKNLNSVNITSSLIVPCEESTTSSDLLRMITGPSLKFDFKIELLSKIPCPIFKERSFSIIARIVDLHGNPVTLPSEIRFKIMIFTTESPSKLLLKNTSGEKIMRGTFEVETNGLISFNNLVIKEVTSHFRNGCFFLVVAPIQAKLIEPLIIENVVVKARKVNNEEAPKKRRKLSIKDEQI